jgi:hypothetical protein
MVVWVWGGGGNLVILPKKGRPYFQYLPFGQKNTETDNGIEIKI